VKKRYLFGGFLTTLISFMFVNNTTMFIDKSALNSERFLLAHRGIAQTYHREDLDTYTCTAKRIYPPEHSFIENTIPSMRAAFDAGADMVELDVKISKDRQLAVFHDATLGCRTNIEGKPWQFTLAELKQLDIAYGYTADDGLSFPLRGKGVALLPSLEEVFAAFPNESFLINFKGPNTRYADLLARLLQNRSDAQNRKVMVYSGQVAPTERMKELMPEIRGFTRKSVKSCVAYYFLIAWTGMIPESCQNTGLLIPQNIGPLLWGWPEKFVSRMEAVNTQVFLIPAMSFREKHTGGIDTKEQIENIPENYYGGVWTNRIDLF